MIWGPEYFRTTQRLLPAIPYGSVWEDIWADREPLNGSPADAVDQLVVAASYD